MNKLIMTGQLTSADKKSGCLYLVYEVRCGKEKLFHAYVISHLATGQIVADAVMTMENVFPWL